MPQTRTEGQTLTRRDYIRRKFQTGELLNGFPLLYPPTERPPPADSFVNGRRTPTYMLCWKLVIESDEVDGRYDCFIPDLRSLFALPRWKERKYADQFGVEILPRLQIVGPYLLILFGVNLSDEYMDSIMRPELVAAAREAYDIADDLPANHELKWRRMDL
ncbi:hypothetical protein BDZ89DRAFT_602332 [Hymenopellis radicata]|nr:hypothetical protein BDZ89DRAFT_602332 [Hymenopellis radicata]